VSRRFQDKFEARLAKRRARETAWWAHPARIIVGTLLLLIGVAIGWLPGPGFVPFATAGGLLLGGEIRTIARWLDNAETWARNRVARKDAEAAFTSDEIVPDKDG
jgi:hypothetical protein